MKNFFSIGMTKQAVLSKMSLDSTNSTTKTRQLIQNFWKTDDDGKIMNEIELAMLNSWANGSEKVKMLTFSEENLKSNSINAGCAEFFDAGPEKKDLLFLERSGSATTAHWWQKGALRQDFLIDEDSDGFADRRICIKFDNSEQLHEHLRQEEPKYTIDIEL